MKERLDALIAAVNREESEGKRGSDINRIADVLSEFTNFWTRVIRRETYNTSLYGSINGEEELHAKRMKENLEMSLNICMNAVATLNAMCDEQGVPHVFDGDISDRQAMAKAIGELILEEYRTGIE